MVHNKKRSNERKTVIFAPWGFPPGWSKIEYHIHINEKGVKIDHKCRTCSSTIALASALKNVEYINLSKIFILGLDSILDPRDYEDGYEYREKVKGKFEEYLNNLIEASEGCLVNKEDFDFIVAPGIGKYYGYEFKGEGKHIFLKAFSALYDYFRNNKVTYIFFDITHGINFQTVVSLYALIAATLAADPNLEKRIFILNSEPVSGYPREKCIKEHIERQTVPELRLIDFSELQTIIQSIRAIINLGKLDERPLVEFLGSIKKEKILENDTLSLVELEDVLGFFRLLRLGVVGPLYPFSNYEKNAKIIDEKIIEQIERSLNKIKDQLVPKINAHANEVTYNQISLKHVIFTALTNIRETIIKKLADSKNLEEYKNALRNLYGAKKLRDKSMMIEREIETIKKIIDHLRRISPDKNTWGKEAYAFAWSALKGIRFDDKRIDKDVDDRNFYAHAGLNFELINSISINENGSEFIEFDEEKLKEALKRIL